MARLAALLLLAGAGLARAGSPPHPAPLATFPAETLRELAPMLRNGDLALIESNDKGALKQLTTVALTAASPQSVYDVVAHPEKYGDFVRNTKQNRVKRGPDGALIHEYSISYGIYTVDGHHRYDFLPPPPGVEGAPGVIELSDPDEGGVRHYRFEFIPVEGGTLVALYGYTAIPHDGFLERFLKAARTLEHGLALVTQMTLMRSMVNRADALAGHPKPPALSGRGSYAPLLKRGTVALLRSSDGRLSDMSLVDRSSARADVLAKVAGEPQEWSKFVPTIKRSTALGQKRGMSAVEIEQALPLVSWTTQFAYRGDAKSADLFGIEGDLHDGRVRFDVRQLSSGVELVMRTALRWEAGSMVLRQLYKMEPLFDYGIQVGMGLVLLEGVRGQAEEITRSQATR